MRAVASLGIERASVPETFPLRLADRLRREGVELGVEGDLFDGRRRVEDRRGARRDPPGAAGSRGGDGGVPRELLRRGAGPG